MIAARLETWAYRAGWAVAKRTPERLVDPALRAVADQAWRRRGRGVRNLERNLARAAPETTGAALRDLSRAAMRSYLRYWGEAFRLPSWDPQMLRRRVIPHHTDRVGDAIASGRGVVAALPHMGNWDLAGAWACQEVAPLTTVAERLRPDSLYDDFVRYRASLGMEVLPLTGGPAPMSVLARRLREAQFVCLLADRDLSRHSVEVALLGESARMPLGPALLAQQTGALLLPVSTSYDTERPGVMHLWVHDEVPTRPGHAGLAAMTADVAETFGRVIRRDPADWHMLQRVFAADLDPYPDGVETTADRGR
ncbi:MAG: phosphatidylinositol mannoside acyltransferase [Nocardioidaceae bacterium]